MLCISATCAVMQCLSSWLVSVTFVYCGETANAKAIVIVDMECE